MLAKEAIHQGHSVVDSLVAALHVWVRRRPLNRPLSPRPLHSPARDGNWAPHQMEPRPPYYRIVVDRTPAIACECWRMPPHCRHGHPPPATTATVFANFVWCLFLSVRVACRRLDGPLQQDLCVALLMRNKVNSTTPYDVAVREGEWEMRRTTRFFHIQLKGSNTRSASVWAEHGEHFSST